MEEDGGGGFRSSKKDKGGEVDYKNKAGTAWSHSFLNQKPWHPLSYPNQRRKWIAEQTHSQNQRRAEEVAREVLPLPLLIPFFALNFVRVVGNCSFFFFLKLRRIWVFLCLGIGAVEFLLCTSRLIFCPYATGIYDSVALLNWLFFDFAFTVCVLHSGSYVSRSF